MTNQSPHNDELPSAVAGIDDTGALQGGKNFVATVKRQGYLSHARNSFYSMMVFLDLIQSMGREKLMDRFIETQLHDLRERNTGPRNYFSAIVLNTVLDGLEYISGAGFKDPILLKRDIGKAKNLMREINMSPNDIAAHDVLLDRRLEEAA